MTKSIRITPDRSHPDGGHAVIHLDGLWLLPRRATFRIDPRGATNGATPPDGWPIDERTPMDLRTTSLGIELVIGPEIVELPCLAPGTPVTVSIPAAGLETEMLWPDLKQARAQPLNAKPDAEAGPTLLARPATVVGRKQPLGVGDESPAPAKPTLNGSADRGRAADSPVLSELTMRGPNGIGRLEDVSGLVGKFENDVRQQAANNASAPAAHRSVARRTAETAVAQVATAPPPERSALSPLLPLVVGLIVTGLLLGLYWVQRGSEPPTAVPAAVDLGAVLQSGPTSPLGTSASGMDGDGAIRLANDFIHGIGVERNSAEAAYWLRKVLSLEPTNRQMRWALTQLGTVYASQSVGGAGDYAVARVLWDMAGAHGDPVALCFSGRLYEQGLGVPVDLAKAREKYERAQQLGGCPGLEQALTRVTE